MGSFIQFDSLSIDLTNLRDNADTGKCEHFSLRGYVSEKRIKDQKTCWPFPVNKSQERQLLLPLEVPKFRWWACQSCQHAISGEGTENKDDRTNSSCGGNGCRFDANCGNEKENNVEVILSRVIALENGLENNLNLQVSSIPSPQVCPSFIQEMDTKKRGREGDEISNVEIVTGNLNIKHSTEHLPLDSIACNHVVPMGNIGDIVKDNIQDHRPKRSTTLSSERPQKMRSISDLLSENGDLVKHDNQDHHPKKSTNLSHKRPQKIRRMTDLLSENGEQRTEEVTGHISSSCLHSNMSTPAQTLSIFADKVDVQDNEANLLSASKNTTNALSGKGKGVNIEEISGSRNKGKTVEVLELGGMRAYYDLTMEDSKNGSFDDIKEVVEMLSRNQYERSLPDVENTNNLLQESTKKGN